MPVCITGMHRSGTSLVANLLWLCGVYLGAESDLLPATADNEGGYWENRKFMTLNDKILRALGGTWDFPPTAPDGWAKTKKFNSLRAEAEILLQGFRDREPWGWKDPRNCLTLPFWMSLNGLTLPFWQGHAPKLKVVLCIRNPFEVFRSLRDREYMPNWAGLDLWLLYYQSVLNSTLPEDRVVTHYEAYFRNARSELQRVLNFLQMPVSDHGVDRAVVAVSDELRHQRFDAKRLSDEVDDLKILGLYRDLCQEARFSETVGVRK